MNNLVEGVLSGCEAERLNTANLPNMYRAAVVRASDNNLFRDDIEKDVRRTIHVDEVPLPPLYPDEVLVAVMASSINFNTIWSATFEPISTFTFLKNFGKQGESGARHDLPYHIIGSDASGVIVRTGTAVRRFKVGDHVVIHPAYIDSEDPLSQEDGMLAEDLRAWGYETNFGGLAEFAIVKATQLLPKAPHLTWEEAASIPLCGSTAYRMLVSQRGAGMKQGDVVLIWGAAGGLGGFAVQLVKNGGGIPIGVVSSSSKVSFAKELGCVAAIDRLEIRGRDENGRFGPRAWRLLRREIRQQIGEDPHIVLDYTGAETFGASVYVVRRGGKIVTCGSSSGYRHEYDNRYLWMHLKSIIGSHGANLQEAAELNRLAGLGMILPTVTKTYPLSEVAEAARAVQTNKHMGKVAVRCLSPRNGLGITDKALRKKLELDRGFLAEP